MSDTTNLSTVFDTQNVSSGQSDIRPTPDGTVVIVAPTVGPYAATDALCYDESGRLLQLFVGSAFGVREWRMVPSFADASKMYGCSKIVGPSE